MVSKHDRPRLRQPLQTHPNIPVVCTAGGHGWCCSHAASSPQGNNEHVEAMRKARVARLEVKGGALGKMATGGQGHSVRVIGSGHTDKTKVE